MRLCKESQKHDGGIYASPDDCLDISSGVGEVILFLGAGGTRLVMHDKLLGTTNIR